MLICYDLFYFRGIVHGLIESKISTTALYSGSKHHFMRQDDFLGYDQVITINILNISPYLGEWKHPIFFPTISQKEMQELSSTVHSNPLIHLSLASIKGHWQTV